MTPEQRVQNRIIKYLKTLKEEGAPLFYEKRQAGGFTYKKGLPDLYLVYAGRHMEVEIKADNGRRSTMQERYEEIFKSIGVPYAVVKSLDEFKSFFAEQIKKIG